MSSPSSSQPLLKIETIQGKGRSVISSQPLKPGQIILKDSPILLYSNSPFIPNNPNQLNNKYCSHCYKILPTTTQPLFPCKTCNTLFCTPTCQSVSTKTSHTTYICHATIQLAKFPHWNNYPEEFQVQARFLLAAYNLAIVSPEEFHVLMSLQGEGGNVVDENEKSNGFVLHSVIETICPVSITSFCLETTASLLVKDKLNAFGLMEPLGTSSFPEQFLVPVLDGRGEQQRSVRAYGIYPNASLFNHDCLPNACRFDYVDHTPAGDASASNRANTDIVIRMIHEVPEGREICLSYFPVNLNYRQRQLRLRDDYGFICSCDRCQVEANWSSSDDDDDRGEIEECDEDDMAMDEDENELMEAGDEEGDEKENDFPHAYFFLRYMCTQQNCGGTLAPLPYPPSSNGTIQPSSSSRGMVMECNVCGNLKNDELEVTNQDASLP